MTPRQSNEDLLAWHSSVESDAQVANGQTFILLQENVNCADIQPTRTVNEACPAPVEQLPSENHPSEAEPQVSSAIESEPCTVPKPTDQEVESLELDRYVSRSSGDSRGLSTGILNTAVAKSPSIAATVNTTAEEDSEEESEYQCNIKIGLVTIGLFLGSFTAAFDDSILVDPGWYGYSYFLTVALCGTLYAFFNVKHTYLTALLVLEVGSIVYAITVNPPILIAGRAIAGVGTAALFTRGMVIIGLDVPLRKRATFVVILSSMFGVWTILGPLLGEAITARLNWRLCFSLNLPFGFVALIIIFIFFEEPRRKTESSTIKEKIASYDGNYYMIPYLVSITLTSLIIGVAITKLGYYNLFVLGGGVIFAVGCGLLYLLGTGDGAGTWIGYQLVVGIGAGACIQIPFLSVQAVLPRKYMPKEIALIAFFNALGGIVSAPIANAVSSNELVKQLQARVPLLDTNVIVTAGLSNVSQEMCEITHNHTVTTEDIWK
ncbi:hypothetical protein G7Y89_g8968 [Cudoniella acicularis]|uniref:Major facilitator superfamily (MFS) profile domain-containing protein n=1 Tax=Cudoniella acicularis TaxID=354080 RepID=A0A8H4RHV8_9HELO|nr:hypothetical protein G7Y89_g8968 [Cudoniella acicularis]